MPKGFDPEDPMELVGVQLSSGDADQELDGIIQEYLLMGWSPLHILFLFRSPHYRATHRIYGEKGEAYVKDRIMHLFTAWSRGWVMGGSGNA